MTDYRPDAPQGDLIDDLVADIIDSANRHVRVAADAMERLASYPALAERYGDSNLGLDFHGSGGRLLRADIHKRLRDKGMSLRQIAAETGVSHEQVRRDVTDVTDVERDAVTNVTDVERDAVTNVTREPPPHEEQEVATPGPEWKPLRDTIKTVRELSDHRLASEVAASVPTHRRSATAKRLRDLGMYFGAVATQLEDMS